MLVVGGAYSLWGAVVGALLISLLDTLLGKGEEGASLGSWDVDFPEGTRLVGVAAVMFGILLFRPSGITGKEFSLRFLHRAGRGRPASPSPEATP